LGIVAESDLCQKIASKKISQADLLDAAKINPAVLPELLGGVSSNKAAVRYGCAKALVSLSLQQPKLVYSSFDVFVNLLDSKYRILTWNAMAIIANLTAVDTDKKFDAVFQKYYSLLNSGYMVTVANLMENSAIIAKNKPYLADRIALELLKVQNLKTTSHLTEECKLVIAEKAIETFNTLICHVQNKQELIEFAKKHQNSPRLSLQKQAQNFLSKWQ
jgi:hypothetical protein